jgi:hypothetical protein
VRYDRLFWRPVPAWDLWRQLKPGGAEPEMIRRRRSCQTVDAVSYSVEDAS